MPGGTADPVDAVLFVMAAGIVIVIAVCAFVGAIDAWRRWSDNRRIRKHLRN
jgi:hypothetical protein